MTLIPIHMTQRSEIRQLGANIDAAVRRDRREHLAAANRSLAALGEAVNWFRPKRDKSQDDDRDDFDGGAAGALVPA